jgi:murein L,D-transpeptidase YcbB/YkuD
VIRRAPIFLLLLVLATPAMAQVSWPAPAKTVGEVGDLIRLMSAIATTSGVEGERLRSGDELLRFYRGRDFRPAWIETSGVSLETADMVELLRRAPLEGLSAERYHVASIDDRLASPADEVHLAQLDLLLTDAWLTYAREVCVGRVQPKAVDPQWRIARQPFDAVAALEQALVQRKLVKSLDALAPPHEGYRRLRVALARYRSVERHGGWPEVGPGKLVLKAGVRDARVPKLRTHMVAEGDLRDEQVKDEQLFDEDLDRAVRLFQERHGLETDGVIGEGTRRVINVPLAERIRQIELNMERWRWLPRDFPKRYILVNMAGYELAIVENGMPIREMRVVVGRDQRQTPAMQTRINAVVINPYWYVPDTVLRQDLLPAVQKDAKLLSRLNIKVFSSIQGNGTEVDAAKLDWNSFNATGPFPYTLRQDPGPGNALGRFKFLLENSPAIYLHDTADPGAFGRRARALSSGCIRLQEPLELAKYVLAPEWDQAKIEAAVAEGKPQQMELAEPLPIFLIYQTVWVNELNETHFREDVYARDAHLDEALVALQPK